MSIINITDGTLGHQLTCKFSSMQIGDYFLFEGELYRKTQNGWIDKDEPDCYILDVFTGIVIENENLQMTITTSQLQIIKEVNLQYIKKEDCLFIL